IFPLTAARHLADGPPGSQVLMHAECSAEKGSGGCTPYCYGEAGWRPPRKEHAMASPTRRIPVPGSERAALPGARMVGAADPHERLSVTVLVRRRPSSPG